MTSPDDRGASRPGPDRRAFLTAAGALLAAGLPLGGAKAAPGAGSGAGAGAGSGSGTGSPRLAAIDWAMLETAIAIGQMPVATCELIRFRQDVVEPEVPEQVVDLGLRGAPNFELLQLTRPDLILTSPFYQQYEHRLAALAPVLSLPFYVAKEPPLPKAIAAMHGLAKAVDDPSAAVRAEQAMDAAFQQAAAALAPYTDRPVCMVQIGDVSHLRAFGNDSLFGNVLARIGLENAWTEQTRFSFLAPVPVARLVDMPDTRLVVVGDIPPEARRGLTRSVLWNSLPAVAGNRVYPLPKVNPFGGVPSALRFARLLAQTFATGPRRVS